MKLPFAKSRHPLHPGALVDRAMVRLGRRNNSPLARLRPTGWGAAIGMTLALSAVALFFVIKGNRPAGGQDLVTSN